MGAEDRGGPLREGATAAGQPEPVAGGQPPGAAGQPPAAGGYPSMAGGQSLGGEPGSEATKPWAAAHPSTSDGGRLAGGWRDRRSDREQQRWQRREERWQRRHERWQQRLDGWEARRHDWERGRRWDSIAWGLLLILVGAVVLADRADSRLDLAHTWPLLIVGFGLILVVLSVVRGIWDD